MKLQLENYRKKCIVETEHEDVDMEEYLDIFIGLLLQAGWGKSTIDNVIIEYAEILKENKL